jgi:nickel-dependent lactate racemase
METAVHDILLNHRLWEGGAPIRLSLPARWNVKVLSMAGDRKPVLGEADYEQAVSALAPLVKGKKEVCVLFDDLSRPTKIFTVVPSLLRLFDACGIMDEQVRFICALGAHAPLDNASLRKKLGSEALERFPVYNHNAFDSYVDLGRTGMGTPILVSKEYHSCDLKIGIGAITPHSFCGFGGGYKLVMPGVSHIDAITSHHAAVVKNPTFHNLGNIKGNELLGDLREFGRKAGLDIKIDLLVNSAADGAGIFAGNPEVDRHHDYVQANGPAHYTTPVGGKADIVFVNAHAKGNEAAIAVSQAESLLKDEGGDIVVLCDTEAGQVVHYIFGRFGEDSWGRLASSAARPRGPKAPRIFVFSRHKDLAGACSLGREEDLRWRPDLGELVRELDEDYRGRPVDVSVVPDGTIQMFAF